jgi:hypothetical protein
LIKQKNYIENINSSEGFYGNHISLPKYSEKYEISNVGDIRHLVKNQSNSQTGFECSIRSSSALSSRDTMREREWNILTIKTKDQLNANKIKEEIMNRRKNYKPNNYVKA